MITWDSVHSATSSMLKAVTCDRNMNGNAVVTVRCPGFRVMFIPDDRITEARMELNER